MLNGTNTTERRPYLTQDQVEEIIEFPTRRRTSRWHGRLLFLLALCVTFAVLGRVLVLDYSFSLILGLVLGFLLRNTD